jgi:Leucine rich repeat/gag-polypeptide of LTR copia-type
MSTTLQSSSETTALIEKLTSLITLQQNQLMVMQQNSQPPIPPLTNHLSETTLHPNVVPIKLDGKNYSLWSQAVRMYIKAREKLSHITDSPPVGTDPSFKRWDIEDTVVKGWICNSLDTNLYGKFLRYPIAKEVWDAIATTFYDGSDATQVFELNKRVNKIKQEGRSVEEYYNELKNIWLEIDFRCPNQMVCALDIEKFEKFTQESRVYSFLDGLDDKLDNERANVLQMTTFPTLEQAFARVRKEATRQEIMRKGYEGEVQTSVAMLSKGQKYFETNYNRSSSYVDKSSLKCTHCGQTRHTKDQCFQIVGYPDWYKDKRKVKHTGLGKGRAAVAQADGGPHQSKTSSMLPIHQGTNGELEANGSRNQHNLSSSNDSQVRGLHAASGKLSFFQTTGTVSPTAETGNCNTIYDFSREEEWVLDSGATDHMTHSQTDLANNQFTGTIPHTIGELKNIISLHLNGNDLTGTIPVEMGNMQALITLKLSINRLEENLPGSLGDLPKLNFVSAYNNKLTGIEPNFSKCKNLTYLALSYNQFSEEFPQCLWDVVGLEYIDLHMNNISTINPDHVAKNSFLKELHLTNNKLA